MSTHDIPPRFAQGFSSWRSVLDAAPEGSRLVIFGSAASEVAGFVANGLDRVAAADELAEIATSFALDTDATQGIIARALVEPARPRAGNGHAELAAQRATAYVAPDPETIPKRAWLFGGHYIRQAATATVGPGGYGKTTLQLYEAINMVADGLRVWYLSGEDPRVELDRRIAAHCEHHRVKLADMPGRLFVDDRVSFQFFIGLSSRPGKVRFDQASLSQFEAALLLDHIDVVMLDPFISFHAVPENDNGCIDAIVKCIAAIAQRTNCCIEISHHVRKPFAGQGNLTVDDARGGSAIINAVRSGRVINRMSAGELERAHHKVKEEKPADTEFDQMRHFYIRVDRGKTNMAPPADKATWFKLVSVPLANGDWVQALRSWDFPGLMDGLSVEDTEFIRELVRHKHYRADSRSDDWLGLEVAKRMSLNPEDKADIKKIQSIIGVWLKNGVFKKMELRDATSRKTRTFYVAMATEKPKDGDAPKVVPLFPENDDNNGDDD